MKSRPNFENRTPSLLFGPNGTGGISLFNCLTGFYRPQMGTILLTDWTKIPRHNIAKLGIARTFQNMDLYSGLSTIDNLMVARHGLMKGNFLIAGIFLGWAQGEEVEHRKAVEEALEAKILLLDEPMAGMNVDEKEGMAWFILDIFETRKIPIVLVEHDMALVMDIADRLIVLDFGIEIAEGHPKRSSKTRKSFGLIWG